MESELQKAGFKEHEIHGSQLLIEETIVLCVEPIAAMFNGVCNESTNIATTFILAADNDMLDRDVYYSRSH